MAEGIAKLKSERTGEILAHGRVSFAQSLVASTLVDEYRLTVFPYLVGGGRSLFAEVRPGPLELVSATAFGNRIAGLVYRRLR